MTGDCAKCHTPLPANGRHVCPPDSTEQLQERLARTLEGRYEITRLLGEGGMAAVFLAQDLVLERQVAIKVLPPEMTRDPQLIRRFQQEAKTAARLDHPNIIPIHRVESERGLVYIVMKYVSGHSLEELLARGPLPISRARHILREAALALGHAHRRRIVHRDVKPANIMVDDDGRVVLTDFGISKATHGATPLTGSGAIIGTPHYMAPEQIRGGLVDGRADQYALAVVAHRILTGKPPFDGDAHSILYQQVHEPPPSVLERRPDTPVDLQAAVSRALSKEAKARFPTMEDFATAISGERSGSTTIVSAPKPASRPKPQDTVKQVANHGSGTLVALATVLVVVVVAWAGLPTLLALTDKSSPPGATVATPSAPRRSAASSPATRSAPTVRYARLNLTSKPTAVVYLNGVRIGPTPISNRRLPLGTHRLRIEQAGYRPISEKLVVKSNKPVVRRYDLKRLPRR